MLLAFLIGIFIGTAGGYFGFKAYFLGLADKASTLWELQASSNEAVVQMRALKAIEKKEAESLETFRISARSALSNYVQHVENLVSQKRIGLSDAGPVFKRIRTYLGYPQFEKEERFFRETMLPAADEFIRQSDLAITTNDVSRWEFDLFDDGRVGGLGSLRIEPKHHFTFFVMGEKSEVRTFTDGNVNTYYDLSFAPQEKVDAVKALLLRNKLNEQTALELAKKFFKLQGHKEENFHPVQIYRLGWTGPANPVAGERHSIDDPAKRGGLLPYYRATWYRKDANLNAYGTLHPLIEIHTTRQKWSA